MEIVRGEISSPAAAALGNALLLDIEHLLKPGVKISQLLLDKSKIDRAKKKVQIISEGVLTEGKSAIVCIGIDGKVDNETCTYKEIENQDGEKVLKKCVTEEHHLTYTYM